MPQLPDYPVTVSRSISWGDMDAFQHVNNIQYFRFFEDARIAYFEAMGLYDPDEPNAFGRVGPILAATSCRFKAPLTYPDSIVVGASVAEIDSDRFELEYAIMSEELGRVAAAGDSVVVSYDYTDRETLALPEDWREAIERLEA